MLPSRVKILREQWQEVFEEGVPLLCGVGLQRRKTA